MKKLITTVALLISIVSVGFSQYYYIPFINAGTNPGGLNNDNEYPVGGGLPAGWTTISLATNATPVWGATQTIPFSFSFNGSPVTQFKVASSGVLTFAVTTAMAAPSYTRAALPDASIPDSSVCIWGLSSLGTNDYIVTKTFGAAPNRQLWVHFSSYSYGSVASDGSNFTYWSIVLEETTNSIYIIDQRNGGYTGTRMVSAGIQINSTTAYSVTGSPNLAAVAGGSATPSDNTYYQFIQGAQQALDVSTISQNLSPNIQRNANNIVSGTIRNFGTTTITSMTMNYNINNGPAVSSPLTSLNIASLTTYNFSHAIPWVPASSGNYTMKIWADNINGSPDQYNLNDTLTATFIVYDSLFVKKVLIEEFTNASCDPCANYKPHMDSAVYTTKDIQNCIRYHVNFPGRDFMNQETQTQVNTRELLYSVTAVPNLIMDGISPFVGGGYVTSVLLDNIHKLSSVMTPFKISITNATYDLATDSINITADLQAYGAFAAGLRAYAVVTDSMHYTNNQSQETIPQYVFPEVMQQMLPSTSGYSLGAYSSGQTQTINFSWKQNRPLATNYTTFPYDSSQFKVVLFIQNLSSKFVWQSELSMVDWVVGVNEIAAGINYLSVYPNPFNSTAFVNFQMKETQHVMLSIYNILGSKVYSNDEGKLGSGSHTLSINKDNLEPGIYFLRIVTDHGAITQKLVIE